MKATYFYSEQQLKSQEARAEESGEPNKRLLAPNGKEYTGVDTRETAHCSYWKDAIIVQVLTGLPVNEDILNKIGIRVAKIPKSKILTPKN